MSESFLARFAYGEKSPWDYTHYYDDSQLPDDDENATAAPESEAQIISATAAAAATVGPLNPLAQSSTPQLSTAASLNSVTVLGGIGDNNPPALSVQNPSVPRVAAERFEVAAFVLPAPSRKRVFGGTAEPASAVHQLLDDRSSVQPPHDYRSASDRSDVPTHKLTRQSELVENDDNDTFGGSESGGGSLSRRRGGLLADAEESGHDFSSTTAKKQRLSNVNACTSLDRSIGSSSDLSQSGSSSDLSQSHGTAQAANRHLVASAEDVEAAFAAGYALDGNRLKSTPSSSTGSVAVRQQHSSGGVAVDESTYSRQSQDVTRDSRSHRPGAEDGVAADDAGSGVVPHWQLAPATLPPPNIITFGTLQFAPATLPPSDVEFANTHPCAPDNEPGDDEHVDGVVGHCSAAASTAVAAPDADHAVDACRYVAALPPSSTSSSSLNEASAAQPEEGAAAATAAADAAQPGEEEEEGGGDFDLDGNGSVGFLFTRQLRQSQKFDWSNALQLHAGAISDGGGGGCADTCGDELSEVFDDDLEERLGGAIAKYVEIRALKGERVSDPAPPQQQQQQHTCNAAVAAGGGADDPSHGCSPAAPVRAVSAAYTQYPVAAAYSAPAASPSQAGVSAGSSHSSAPSTQFPDNAVAEYNAPDADSSCSAASTQYPDCAGAEYALLSHAGAAAAASICHSAPAAQQQRQPDYAVSLVAAADLSRSAPSTQLPDNGFDSQRSDMASTQNVSGDSAEPSQHPRVTVDAASPHIVAAASCSSAASTQYPFAAADDLAISAAAASIAASTQHPFAAAADLAIDVSRADSGSSAASTQYPEYITSHDDEEMMSSTAAATTAATSAKSAASARTATSATVPNVGTSTLASVGAVPSVTVGGGFIVFSSKYEGNDNDTHRESSGVFNVDPRPLVKQSSAAAAGAAVGSRAPTFVEKALAQGWKTTVRLQRRGTENAAEQARLKRVEEDDRTFRYMNDEDFKEALETNREAEEATRRLLQGFAQQQQQFSAQQQQQQQQQRNFAPLHKTTTRTSGAIETAASLASAGREERIHRPVDSAVNDIMPPNISSSSSSNNAHAAPQQQGGEFHNSSSNSSMSSNFNLLNREHIASAAITSGSHAAAADDDDDDPIVGIESSSGYAAGGARELKLGQEWDGGGASAISTSAAHKPVRVREWGGCEPTQSQSVGCPHSQLQLHALYPQSQLQLDSQPRSQRHSFGQLTLPPSDHNGAFSAGTIQLEYRDPRSDPAAETEHDAQQRCATRSTALASAAAETEHDAPAAGTEHDAPAAETEHDAPAAETELPRLHSDDKFDELQRQRQYHESEVFDEGPSQNPVLAMIRREQLREGAGQEQTDPVSSSHASSLSVGAYPTLHDELAGDTTTTTAAVTAAVVAGTVAAGDTTTTTSAAEAAAVASNTAARSPQSRTLLVPTFGRYRPVISSWGGQETEVTNYSGESQQQQQLQSSQGHLNDVLLQGAASEYLQEVEVDQQPGATSSRDELVPPPPPPQPFTSLFVNHDAPLPSADDAMFEGDPFEQYGATSTSTAVALNDSEWDAVDAVTDALAAVIPADRTSARFSSTATSAAAAAAAAAYAPRHAAAVSSIQSKARHSHVDHDVPPATAATFEPPSSSSSNNLSCTQRNVSLSASKTSCIQVSTLTSSGATDVIPLAAAGASTSSGPSSVLGRVTSAVPTKSQPRTTSSSGSGGGGAIAAGTAPSGGVQGAPSGGVKGAPSGGAKGGADDRLAAVQRRGLAAPSSPIAPSVKPKVPADAKRVANATYAGLQVPRGSAVAAQAQAMLPHSQFHAHHRGASSSARASSISSTALDSVGHGGAYTRGSAAASTFISSSASQDNESTSGHNAQFQLLREDLTSSSPAAASGVGSGRAPSSSSYPITTTTATAAAATSAFAAAAARNDSVGGAPSVSVGLIPQRVTSGASAWIDPRAPLPSSLLSFGIGGGASTQKKAKQQQQQQPSSSARSAHHQLHQVEVPTGRSAAAAAAPAIAAADMQRPKLQLKPASTATFAAVSAAAATSAAYPSKPNVSANVALSSLAAGVGQNRMTSYYPRHDSS